MFVKLEKNIDGSHTFQSGGSMIEGWAIVPREMPLPESFPFVNIEAAEIFYPAILDNDNNILEPAFTQIEVVSMTEGEEIIVEEVVVEFTAQDDTDAMLVDQEYRLTLLELGIL